MQPEGVELSPDGSIMTTDEILRLVGLFVQAGVTKIRLTGGEPLVLPHAHTDLPSPQHPSLCGFWEISFVVKTAMSWQQHPPS